MSRFKIVSVGWRCGPWWEQTLRSIETQTDPDWDVRVTYDGGDDAGADIAAWCYERDERWHFAENAAQRFAVRNQFEAISSLDPADDDIIVFLDLDGDMFAHREVLAHLRRYYADDTLVTYGSYVPVPMVDTCTPATPFPASVVRQGSYRRHMLAHGCCFNHLRTMKGRVFKAITPDQFRWLDGRWYEGGTDYIFMVAALELAAGRYKCIEEVLLAYNHANPYADNVTRPRQSTACVLDYLNRPPLARLP